jgi:SAM-dependent methyltransferase
VPRPCRRDHTPSPRTCRLCYWCADRSETGAFHRRLWGEPEPDGRRAGPRRELVAGLPDPIPEPELTPLPPRWPYDPRVAHRHRAALWGLARAELPPPGPRSGAGVLVVGGGKYWPGIVVALRMLRDTGSTLPVQIWHRGSHEPVRAADLAGLGAAVHDLTALAPAPRILRGWEAKTVALLACGWERVFFLDADAYCVDDPAPLLEGLSAHEPFRYWQDGPGSDRAVNWRVWGLDARRAPPPVQGGQLAIHVRHFWRELLLAHWLNQHSDFSYTHQFGDQDSWRVALALTGGRYRCLGPARWDDIAFVCAAGGRPVVVHRCRSKLLFPEDVAPGDVESNRRLDRLPAEARVWAYWDALRAARTAGDVFGRIYASGLWGPSGLSGAGSTPPQALPYLNIVNGLVKAAGWHRVVDLGCGDGWVTARLAAARVVGVDCHAPHIARLRREVPDRAWAHLDLDADRDRLPAGDVALVKDVLHHWPNRLVRDWLAWARGCGKWRWLVCTQDRFQRDPHHDCPLGGYRALDPALEPLRGLGLIPFCDYLHKGVLLLPALSPAAGTDATGDSRNDPSP